MFFISAASRLVFDDGGYLRGLWRLKEQVQYSLGGGQIGRQRHIVDVTYPEQGGDIGFVGLCRQRVAQEYDRLDGVAGYHSPYLLVAPQRAALHQRYRQAGCLLYHSSGASGGHQVEVGQLIPVSLCQTDYIVFLGVVGD